MYFLIPDFFHHKCSRYAKKHELPNTLNLSVLNNTLTSSVTKLLLLQLL